MLLKIFIVVLVWWGHQHAPKFFIN